jgi:exodeoxyribonuclease V alpha subunit
MNDLLTTPTQDTLSSQAVSLVKTVPLLNYLLSENRVRMIDVKLAELLCGETTSDVFFIIVLVGIAQQNQSSCLVLNEVDWQNPFAIRPQDLKKIEGDIPDKISPFEDNYTLESALKSLLVHNSVGVSKPMQVQNQRLYFTRLAEYETIIASGLIEMSQRNIDYDTHELKSLLNKYFGDSSTQNDIDWQKVACAIAATKGFSVITGGPGTGKTTTVTKLLAILQSLAGSDGLKIQLVAPTGKAAARLSESILAAKEKLSGIDHDIKALIPSDAQTIHRLLGVRPLSNKFRHNKSNPLHLDVLIIDEASMVDLSLMAKLFEALPQHARLILLGDKDQLSSVDTGSVLSDLCQGLELQQTPSYSAQRINQLNQLCFDGLNTIVGPNCDETTRNYKLRDCIAFLQHSYRFDEKSGIAQLALTVNTNNSGKLKYVEQEIKDGFFTDLILNYDLTAQALQGLVSNAAQHYSHYLRLVNEGASASQIHKAFADYQLLAAVKDGDFGVKKLNLLIEKALLARGLINQNPNERHYAGMPIMIQQNDYQLGLFNGDIGILVSDEHNQLNAIFVDEQGQSKTFSPARLPAHETVYAMTIHKSQGSEFAHTAMVLPPLTQASVGINRQLVYTGITRAKTKFEVLAERRVLEFSMDKSVSRASGLYQRLIE